MKPFATPIIVALLSVGMIVPASADVISTGAIHESSPHRTPSLDGLSSLTSGDIAFFGANLGADRTAGGLTADEFVYGSLLLIVVGGIIVLMRARNARHG
ncbi:MAG: hypothetical protein A2Z34_06505 [Planctomycetes bacterium RBG_16_59_8]|nr:MAG: hypothetical protein A2Z34_06505 [Planctomycetes bacterium RBG_16_59_8]